MDEIEVQYGVLSLAHFFIKFHQHIRMSTSTSTLTPLIYTEYIRWKTKIYPATTHTLRTTGQDLETALGSSRILLAGEATVVWIEIQNHGLNETARRLFAMIAPENHSFGKYHPGPLFDRGSIGSDKALGTEKHQTAYSAEVPREFFQVPFSTDLFSAGKAGPGCPGSFRMVITRPSIQTFQRCGSLTQCPPGLSPFGTIGRRNFYH